jgi:hypothetical protein
MKMATPEQQIQGQKVTVNGMSVSEWNAKQKAAIESNPYYTSGAYLKMTPQEYAAGVAEGKIVVTTSGSVDKYGAISPAKVEFKPAISDEQKKEFKAGYQSVDPKTAFKLGAISTPEGVMIPKQIQSQPVNIQAKNPYDLNATPEEVVANVTAAGEFYNLEAQKIMTMQKDIEKIRTDNKDVSPLGTSTFVFGMLGTGGGEGVKSLLSPPPLISDIISLGEKKGNVGSFLTTKVQPSESMAASLFDLKKRSSEAEYQYRQYDKLGNYTITGERPIEYLTIEKSGLLSGFSPSMKARLTDFEVPFALTVVGIGAGIVGGMASKVATTGFQGLTGLQAYRTVKEPTTENIGFLTLGTFAFSQAGLIKYESFEGIAGGKSFTIWKGLSAEWEGKGNFPQRSGLIGIDAAGKITRDIPVITEATTSKPSLYWEQIRYSQDQGIGIGNKVEIPSAKIGKFTVKMSSEEPTPASVGMLEVVYKNREMLDLQPITRISDEGKSISITREAQIKNIEDIFTNVRNPDFVNVKTGLYVERLIEPIQGITKEAHFALFDYIKQKGGGTLLYDFVKNEDTGVTLVKGKPGIIFGSSSRQAFVEDFVDVGGLKIPLQKLNIGDYDVMFRGTTETGLKGISLDIAKIWKSKGLKTRVDTEKGTSVEVNIKGVWEKKFEAKSDIVIDEQTAQTKVFGFDIGFDKKYNVMKISSGKYKEFKNVPEMKGKTISIDTYRRSQLTLQAGRLIFSEKNTIEPPHSGRWKDYPGGWKLDINALYNMMKTGKISKLDFETKVAAKLELAKQYGYDLADIQKANEIPSISISSKRLLSISPSETVRGFSISSLGLSKSTKSSSTSPLSKASKSPSLSPSFSPSFSPSKSPSPSPSYSPSKSPSLSPSFSPSFSPSYSPSFSPSPSPDSKSPSPFSRVSLSPYSLSGSYSGSGNRRFSGKFKIPSLRTKPKKRRLEPSILAKGVSKFFYGKATGLPQTSKSFKKYSGEQFVGLPTKELSTKKLWRF